MNKPELSNIKINRNGVLCESLRWLGQRVRLLDGWSMDDVFDNIDQSRVNDLLKRPEGSRYINFTTLRNEPRKL